MSSCFFCDYRHFSHLRTGFSCKQGRGKNENQHNSHLHNTQCLFKISEDNINKESLGFNLSQNNNEENTKLKRLSIETFFNSLDVIILIVVTNESIDSIG